MTELRVANAGLCSSIQDFGRWKFQRFGVAVGGAMDLDAHRLANILVGNETDAAAIEIAWYGSSFSFSQPTLIAITGADLLPTIAGQRVLMYRPFLVRQDRPIQFHHARKGCYAYLSVAGGIDVPMTMASRATHIRSGIGGLNGRALQAGDVVPIGDPSEVSRSIIAAIRTRWLKTLRPTNIGTETDSSTENGREAHWFIDPTTFTNFAPGNSIRVMRGRHFDLLDAASRRRFWTSEFCLSQSSDRMGYRLDGPELCFKKKSIELPSGGVVRGTIQLPAGGSLIVLMADAATTGGYPHVAHVATVDFARLAQTQPGQSIRFSEIDLSTAQRLIAAKARDFRQLARAISIRSYASRV